MVIKRCRWEAAEAFKGSARSAEPSRRPGLYLRRGIECLVRSMTSCAISTLQSAQDAAGRSRSSLGAVTPLTLIKIIETTSSSSFSATPLQSWVNWYCRDGENTSSIDLKKKEMKSVLALRGENRIKLSVHISAPFTDCPSGTTRHSIMWTHSSVVSFSSHKSPSFGVSWIVRNNLWSVIEEVGRVYGRIKNR